MCELKNKWIRFVKYGDDTTHAYVIRKSVMKGLYLVWAVDDTVRLIDSGDIIEEIGHDHSLILSIRHGDAIHKCGYAYT